MPQPRKQSPAASAAGGRVIDLASARAARAEAAAEPVTLKWDDETSFTLPAEMPADFLLLAQEGNLRGAVAALMGEQADAFFALRPSMDDITALAELAGDAYGMKPGEAPASADS